MNDMKRYYHVYTKGLEQDVIFRERADYIVGMNYVPVSLHGLDLQLLAFVLMSNHFHFVIYGTKDECDRFINTYKKVVSMYVRKKYGTRKILRAVKVSCSEVDSRDDGLKRLIAYVLNNPVKAGIKCLPQNYEWGSGRCYFTNLMEGHLLKQLSDYNVREQIALLKSEVKLDGKLIVNGSGYIEPSSYVNVTHVENLFRNVRSMEYFLSVSNRTASEKEGPATFSDTLVLSGLQELLENKYESLELDSLSYEVRKKLILEIRRQFNCSPKQLARVFNSPLNYIVNLLNE